MPFHYESNVDPYHKFYLDGYAAYTYGKDITEIPFTVPESSEIKDLESPKAEAWLKGYYEAIESEADVKLKETKKSDADAKLKEMKKQQEIAKLKEMKKNEEIALLERMYNKKSE